MSDDVQAARDRVGRSTWVTCSPEFIEDDPICRHATCLLERMADEIDRLRAELAQAYLDMGDDVRCVELQAQSDLLTEQRDDAEAAIARVRELCAAHAGDDAVLRASVLEAIEGERT